ncbi:MAG: YgaP family membrane protein [Methylocystis sp.]|uniref:YgaP family membrane protein n=1 Tax=Methylocystis sp. TaxID=1911079 RepID=UPI003DA585AF
MLYVKNLPGWERAARVAMGAGLLAASVLHFGPTPMGWGVGAMGAMAAMSGLLGFCPACAMVRRRLQR